MTYSVMHYFQFSSCIFILSSLPNASPNNSTNKFIVITQLNSKCGMDSRFYCPVDSTHALIIGEGYYATESHIEDGRGYENQSRCQPGSYCVDGIRYLCPGGYYGSRYQETNILCSGICQQGYYCPLGSIVSTERPCGNISVYCPQGSVSPIHVSPGYYTIRDTNVSSFEQRSDSESSSEAYSVAQTICTPRTFCTGDGHSRLCPSGCYGSTFGLLTSFCTGTCREGFYCPIGSMSDTEKECGGSDQFCPSGSSFPTQVDIGYYSLNTTEYHLYQTQFIIPSIQSSPSTSSTSVFMTQVFQLQCEFGHYCIHGIKYACPAGFYGDARGLHSPVCSGVCPIGFYCPVRTSSYTSFPCGNASVYCPVGSSEPTHVSVGYYTINTSNKALVDNVNDVRRMSIIVSGDNSMDDSMTRTTQGNQLIAPAGYYAYGGILQLCQSGYFGNTTGNYVPTCDGPCLAGYYCPSGSVTATAYVCGGDDVYCPLAASQPTPVQDGYYTAEYESSSSQCPLGTWRNMSKSIDLSTNQLSVITTQKSIPNCELCPFNTYKNIMGDDLSLCRICNDKHAESMNDRRTCYCNRVVLETQFTYYNLTTESCMILEKSQFSLDFIHNFQPYLPTNLSLVDRTILLQNTSMTREIEYICEKGYYCIKGIKYACSAGRYGSITGLSNSECSGICQQNYYCPVGSRNSTAVLCHEPNWYCPEGSAAPIVIQAGYYSTTTNITNNNENNSNSSNNSNNSSIVNVLSQMIQALCPRGFYCPGDGKKYPCTAGRYSDQVIGVSTADCLGPCLKGYYCAEGSDSKSQYPCGNSSVYCKTGSSIPTRIHDGFYGVFTGTNAGTRYQWDEKNETFSAELVCEKGYYCTGGIKNPCTPGRYGGRVGLYRNECSGECARGYYCPSYLLPSAHPHVPVHTIWPLQPQIRANDYPCGDVTVYCPQGSYYPITVSGGYYTIGGNSDNTTRSNQRVCEKGSYCVGGISYLCPSGRYGNTSGLSLKVCSGRCNAGYYCPPGTVTPLRCPERTYSSGDAAECTQCPGIAYSDHSMNNCRESPSCC